MAKSVNDYYAEKMKKLLEMQGESMSPSLAAPTDNKSKKTSNKNGRSYYEEFRKEAKKKYDSPKASTDNFEKTKEFAEQTELDRILEEQRKEEAEQRARRGKKLRTVRDGAISVVLITAVIAVLLIVVYRLVFVVSDITVVGADHYSEKEIIAAAGVKKGDHLYSFRNSIAAEKIKIQCPLVGEVEVDKKAPSTVTLTVKEDKTVFYADFYGEFREVSDTLRILYAVSEKEAKENKLVKLKLPTVKNAFSGQKAEFSGIRNDEYIYEVTKLVMESSLWERVNSIDLTDKYQLSVNCDGKYKIILGEVDSVDIKLRIAQAVLKDEMFNNDNKAKINVSDLSATSVITDNTLEID